MTLRRLLGMGALLFILVFAAPAVKAAPAPGAEGAAAALAQVPADAPIVAQLHGVERTKDRLLAMLKTALPDQQPQIKTTLEGLLSSLPEGRKLKGLDKDAPLFLVFPELPDPNAAAPPKGALIVGVSNYKEFRDALLTDEERKSLKPGEGYEVTTVNDHPVYFVDRGTDNVAIVTPDKETAVKLAKKPAQGLDKKLSPELAKTLTASDIGLYVDMAVVNKKFGDQLKDLKEQIEKGIEAAPGGDKTTQELVKKLLDPVFRAIQDSKAVLLTVEFRPEGLSLAMHGEVDAKSKTNDLLKDAKPGAVTELEKMPAGYQTYSAVQLRGAVLKDFGGLLMGAAGGKEGDAAVKGLKEGLDLLAESKPHVQVSASSLPPRGLTVLTCDDPSKAVEGMLKMYRGMKGSDSLFTTPLKGEPMLKEKAEKYGGFELNYFSAKWDLEKMVEQQAANPLAGDKEKFTAYMKSLVGEGQDVWFGTDGKVLLAVTAKDFADAKKIIDEYAKGGKTVGGEQAFKDIRKQMPAETTALSLVDLPSVTETMLTAMGPLLQGAAPVPPNFFKAKVKGQTAFLGLSLTLQPQRGSAEVFVPAQAVHELYKMYIKDLLGGGF